MSEHTRGPWEVVPWTDSPGHAYLAAGEKLLAEIWLSNDEQRANANVMAASPNLLEALKYAVKQVPELASVPGIRAAIAKAEGRE